MRSNLKARQRVAQTVTVSGIGLAVMSAGPLGWGLGCVLSAGMLAWGGPAWLDANAELVRMGGR